MTVVSPGDPEVPEKSRLTRTRFRLHRLHWYVVACSVALTLAAAWYAENQHQEKIDASFDREAHRVVELVVERMGQYESGLRSGVGALISHHGHMTRQQWRDFAQQLSLEVRQPGGMGIGVIRRVPHGDVKALVKEQEPWFPGFKIHPPSRRAEYFPIVYIEPVKSNKKAVGLDMAHEGHRHEALIRARDSGQPQITEPIILVQDAERTPGFLFFVPLYGGPSQTLEERRRNFTQLVYAPFIVKKLLSGALAGDKRHVTLSISDEGRALYDENSIENADYDPNPSHQLTHTVNMFGRPWTFTIAADKNFHRAMQSTSSFLILIVGLTLDALLVYLFASLVRSNARAASLLERSEDFRLSVEAAPTGMLMVDTNGTIVLANEACTQLLGYERPELIGRAVDTLVPEGLRDKHANDRQRFTDEATTSRAMGTGKDLFARRADGVQLPVEVGLTPIRKAGRVFVICSIVDVSERRSSLRALEVMNAELQAKNKEMQQFIFAVSHDLKAPLVTIGGFAKRLVGALEGDALAEPRRWAERIVANTANTTVLLNRLLDLSRLAHRPAAREPVQLDAVLEEVRGAMLQVLENADASVVVDTPLPEVCVEPTHIRQIFLNLLGNAVKYRRPDVCPIISVSASIEGRQAVLCVADNGRGIPPQYLDRIFDLFERGDAAVEGTGVGLALCKAVVEKNGGRIWVTSEVGQGSQFYVALPLVQEDTSKTREELAS